MTKLMLHATVHGPDDIRVEQAQRPSAGPDDIVVKVVVCGICGSDLGYARAGGLPMGGDGPLSLGHEFSGVIEEVGARVTALRKGQRVVVNPTTPANMIGSGGPGAFASHILVRNVMAESSVYPIPDTLDFETAALVEPLAVALHGVNRSRAGAGSKVVVFGAGPIGLGVVAMLRLRGVADIIAVDRVDSRLERARALGANATFNPDNCDLWAEIGKRHSASTLYGMPVVDTDEFIEVSGAAPVIPQIIARARFGAHLTVVAVHHAPVAMDLAMALGKEMEVTTAMAYPTEFGEVLEILAAGRIDTTALISHRYAFEDFEQAFATAARADESAKVLVTFGKA